MNTILRTLSGSRAYGAETQNSDYDFMSIVVAPVDFYLGNANFGNSGTIETSYDDPIMGFVGEKYFEIKKAMKLLAGFNPTIIPVLWANKEHYTTVTKHGKMLLDNRIIFNSKIAYRTFVNYTQNQLKNCGNIFYDAEEENMLLKGGYNRFMEETVDSIVVQRQYRDIKDARYDSGYLNAMIELKGHAEFQHQNIKSAPSTGKMGAKRKAIRDKYGFDTKFMYHAIRLMRMAVEFLKNPENGLHVDRRDIDAKYLIDIRNGLYSAENLKNDVDELLAKAKELVKVTDLPDKPDYDKINDLTVQIIRKNI